MNYTWVLAGLGLAVVVAVVSFSLTLTAFLIHGARTVLRGAPR